MRKNFVWIKFKKLIFALLNKSYWKGLRHLVFPSIEHIDTFNFIKKNNIDLIIDVGTNKGQFSLLVNNIIPNSAIIGFEPIKSEFRIYKSIFRKKKDIKIFHLALGEENKRSIINIASSKDSSSLLKINQNQTDLYGTHSTSKTQEVNVEKLDNFIDLIDKKNNIFMKIDVQGYEYQVIKGSTKSLKFITYLYVECSNVELYKNQMLFKDIENFLSSHNFFLQKIFNKDINKNGEIIQADYLFTRKENLVN